MNVYADLRWSWQNGSAGIDNVKRELLSRAPAHATIVELPIGVQPGSALSPLAIAVALRRMRPVSGVFWSPGFMPPARSSVPAVVTVHDLIHLRHYSRLHRTYYEHVLRPLYRRCRTIVCVSEHTRREFLHWSGMPQERVVTLYNGVSAGFWSADGSERPVAFPYVLYAGNRRAHKNLDRLLDAYGRSALAARGIHLVLTGEPDARLRARAARFRVEDFVHFSGQVAAATMPALYRHAHAVVLVSLDEGFGLPIVEAMAAGVPVLTSNVSAMPEIAGGAALLADPLSVESIRGGLEALAFDRDERERRIALGRARARAFDWNAAARGWWQILDEASAARTPI